MILTPSEVASLKSALDFWEWFEYISTAVVFIGCVGEYFADFTTCPKSKLRRHKLGKLSLIILIAGIAGEFLGTVRSSQLSGQIIADVEKQASDANERAGIALRQQEVLRSGNLNLEIEVLSLQKELLIQGPREKLLTGETRTVFVDSLKPFAGQEIDIRCELMTGGLNGISLGNTGIFDEIVGLAKALIGVLDEAHWNAPRVLSTTRSGLKGRGVSVHISPNASLSTRKAAEALVKTLREVPLEASGPTSDLVAAEEPDGNAILVVVHPKPK